MTTMTFQKNQIVLGDAKTLSLSLSDNSVDCVCTDPPYLKKDVEGGIYSWLAEVSARVLKPGGFCIAYCGTYWLAQVLAQMTPHLTFFWEYRILFRDGYTAGIHYQRRTKPCSTPLLVFQKKSDHRVLPYRTVLDVYKGAGADKSYHKWGQDAYSIQFYLDCFSKTGDLVADFFCGGGTVPYVCAMTGRDFIACDLDHKAVTKSQARMLTVQQPLFETAVQSGMWEVSA